MHQYPRRFKHKDPGQTLETGPIKCQCCPHIESSQLICYANQLIGFYIRAALAFNTESNYYAWITLILEEKF